MSLGLIIGGIFGILSLIFTLGFKHDIWLLGIGALLGILAVIIICIATFNIKQIQAAEIAIENGAKVYIDGQEINSDNIVLNNYDITIKDGKVILSD